MKRTICALLLAMLMSAGFARSADAHCEVPCGIFHDQIRFEQMLEDQETIAKAMKQINELVSKEADAQSHNQLTRWIITKEEHAKNTQKIIAQYFMAQRIKPGTDPATNVVYTKQLIAAHNVMRAAMKSKQTVDPAQADALRKAILDLYRAYEGKEPQLHKHD